MADYSIYRGYGKSINRVVTRKSLIAKEHVRFELGSDAAGDIYYSGNEGDLTRLPIGEEGHVLTSINGKPVWVSMADASGNGTVQSITVNTNGDILVNGVTSATITDSGIFHFTLNINSNAINEGSSNLYYTDSRVRAAISALSPLVWDDETGQVSITQAAGSIDGYLSATDWNTFNNKVYTASNEGSDSNRQGLFIGRSGTTLQFKSLVPGSNVSFDATVAGELKINAISAGGETITVANNGTSSDRQGLFVSKVGSVLNFKSLVPGNNVSFDTTTAGELKINSIGGDTGLTAAYVSVTDGTTTASATTSETLRFNAGNNLLTVAVTAGATDAVTYTVNATAIKALISATAPISYIDGVISITQANGTTHGYLTSTNWAIFNNKVDPSRTIATLHSISGGGDLSANRTFTLVGDVASPGNNMLYGTNGIGVRGWYAQPTSGSGGLMNAFVNMTDGTTVAAASGADTFKLRSANNILAVSVSSNDATHGDNAIFTVVESNINIANTTGSITISRVSGLSSTAPITLVSGVIGITQSTTTTNGYLSSGDWNTFNSKVDPSRSILTQYSISGGGTLAANRTLQFVNDLPTPGNNMLYGTNGTGVRGWYAQPVAVGGGLNNAYTSITDGITTASASGEEVIKFRSANNILTVTIASNDVTHGDNILFTVNQSNINIANITGTLPYTRVTGISAIAPISYVGGVISIAAANGTTNGYISSADWTTFNNKVDATRSIATINSIIGGGNLSANRILQLSGDINTPGNNMLYGTNSAGTKGWYVQPASGLMNAYHALSNGVVTATASGSDTITFRTGNTFLTIDLTSDDATYGDSILFTLGSASSTADGYLTMGDWNTFNNKVSASRTISTINSITGGGTLAGNRTLQLVGDVANPLPNQLYGTNNTGVRGWYNLPAVGGSGTVTAVNSNNIISGGVTLWTVVVANNNTTPTFSFTASSQSANTFYAGPASGGAAQPLFRLLSSNDIPSLDASKITTGVLPIARGGTGLTAIGTTGQLIRSNGTALEYFTPTYLTSNAHNHRISNHDNLTSFTVGVNETLQFVNGNGTTVVVNPTARTVSYSHDDTSTVGSITTTGATIISGLTFDTYGHVLSRTTRNITAADIGAITTIAHKHRVYNSTAAIAFDYDVNEGIRFNNGNATVVSFDAATKAVTYSHADTSTVANLTVPSGQIIASLTFDTYGHITGYTTQAIVSSAYDTIQEDQVSRAKRNILNFEESFAVTDNGVNRTTVEIDLPRVQSIMTFNSSLGTAWATALTVVITPGVWLVTAQLTISTFSSFNLGLAKITHAGDNIVAGSTNVVGESSTVHLSCLIYNSNVSSTIALMGRMSSPSGTMEWQLDGVHCTSLRAVRIGKFIGN